MKKIFFIITLCLANIMYAPAQEIYKEVNRMKESFDSIKNNTKQSMDVRLIATFKEDALYYLLMNSGKDENFTERELGKQANAMIDFVNSFLKEYTKAETPQDENRIIEKYKSISLNYSLFNDMDKDVTYAYMKNNNYLTRFSLDTDWVKALEDVRSK